MSFQGDLSSIALSDVLQNLESGGKSGTLTITDGDLEVARIRIDRGKITGLARPGRLTLPQLLVRQGRLTEAQIKSAKAKRRGTRKSIGEVLVLQNRIAGEDLLAVASRALSEDVCDLVAETVHGEFFLDEGPPPPRVFDAEETQLGLALPVSHVLLEGARRSDHWALIRQAIPSDATHYFAGPDCEPPLDAGDPELVRYLLQHLDGTRPVSEIVDLVPGRRFETYTALAFLVRERFVRATEGDELLAI
ncbi:MAG: DUF4388 domain-containing protein, partial [Planctomycetes bacterium]|nr:DUF4388 domain-containing protein [Planctomycetota bacterium]